MSFIVNDSACWRSHCSAAVSDADGLFCFAALFISVFEWCLKHGPIRRVIEQQFSSVSPNAQKLRQNVYQAVIRIIGFLHLAIQVPHTGRVVEAHAQLQHW